MWVRTLFMYFSYQNTNTDMAVFKLTPHSDVTKCWIHRMYNGCVFMHVYMPACKCVWMRYIWQNTEAHLVLWSWTLLKWSIQLIHCVHTVCYSLQLCTYYRLSLLVLGCVIVFLWKNYYLNICIDFVKFMYITTNLHPTKVFCNCTLKNNI